MQDLFILSEVGAHALPEMKAAHRVEAPQETERFEEVLKQVGDDPFAREETKLADQRLSGLADSTTEPSIRSSKEDASVNAESGNVGVDPGEAFDTEDEDLNLEVVILEEQVQGLITLTPSALPGLEMNAESGNVGVDPGEAFDTEDEDLNPDVVILEEQLQGLITLTPSALQGLVMNAEQSAESGVSDPAIELPEEVRRIRISPLEQQSRHSNAVMSAEADESIQITEVSQQASPAAPLAIPPHNIGEEDETVVGEGTSLMPPEKPVEEFQEETLTEVSGKEDANESESLAKINRKAFHAREVFMPGPPSTEEATDAFGSKVEIKSSRGNVEIARQQPSAPLNEIGLPQGHGPKPQELHALAALEMIGATAPSDPFEQARLAEAQAPNLVRRITNELSSMVKMGRTSLRVHVVPEELGAIDLHVISDSEGVQVIIRTDQSATGTMLQRHLNDLKQTLSQAGVTITHFDINHQNEQRGSSEYPGKPAQIRLKRSSAGERERVLAPNEVSDIRPTSTLLIDTWI